MIAASSRADGLRRTLVLGGAGAAAGVGILVVASLLAVPLQEFAQLLAGALTSAVVDLGDGWIAWTVSPANSIGSLIVLSVKGIRLGRRRLASDQPSP